MGAEDAEALRRRLYAPGATAADLATYLHVAAAEGHAEEAVPHVDVDVERGPSVRPFVVGAICVAAAAALGGLLLSGALTPPTAAPTVLAATPASADSASATGGNQVEFVIATVLDGGSEVHARGTAVQEGPDRYRYAVAAGDTADGIASRFGVCAGDVLVALPYGVDPASIPVGTTIELAKLTSTTC